jgi:2',3'-cyclic-nucleotide 2'-phosphodiesterase (5'-nucleotidase family)/3',5'-cyclic AMP phosphodiesterase CpdA
VLGLLPGSILTAVAAVSDPQEGDIVILYTNDVHCSVDQISSSGVVTNIGYAGVAAYKKEMEAINGVYVTLADAGDALQGKAIGTLSKGEYLVDIMNQVGYDIFVPGNHEFDFGMARMQELMGKLNAEVISSNFTKRNPDTEADLDTVYEPYTIKTYGEGDAAVKVAFVGITTPESFTKSTPAYFQDENGKYIYGFKEKNEGQDLYQAVQQAVNAAKAEGAEYVIAVGHLGVDLQSAPWRSTDVIANTTGIDAFIDGHSHSTIESQIVENAANGEVLLTQTGTELAAIGRLIIKANDGGIEANLIKGYGEQDEDTADFIADIEEEFNDDLAQVVGKTDVPLTVNDPVTKGRIVRNKETNLGDLCADAYRFVLGNGKSGADSKPADVAFVNGGGIRTNIDAGDITFGEVIAVHPFNNVGCVVEATGQEILDALEMAARVAPAENGGFLQVSGLTYSIDTTVPSTVVVDDKKNFVEVSGDRRVKNVMIGYGGSSEAIDRAQTYTVASHNYMLLDGGDGINMFRDNKVVVPPVLLDNQVLISYIQDYLGGIVGDDYANPYGQGRITIKTGAQPVGFENSAASLPISQIASYSTGEHDPEGGIQEIVTYNPVNQFAYSVNGKYGMLTAISMKGLNAGSNSVAKLDGTNTNVESLVNIDGFDYGDMTSVAVSPDGTKMAVAIQAGAYDQAGRVALFSCDSDGVLSFTSSYQTGVQPDMVVFADNNTVLTADEGEPRMGYGGGADPKGTVTVVDLAAGTSVQADFTEFDETTARAGLVNERVVLKKGAAPSVDLEPEYIAVSGTKAYVSLQEANSVAVLDLPTRKFTGVYPLGVQDYSKVAIDLDNTSEKDGGKYTPRYYENTYGLRMPDGIASYQKGGKTYLLTANEGDSREWGVESTPGYYINENEKKLTAADGVTTEKKVRLLSTDYEGPEGLSDGSKNYLFGGRSFSVFEAGENGLTLVYDSEDAFESKTAAYLPAYFNCSNDNSFADNRSNKKGPEPETVTVGTVNGRTYAFIALERIGGVMVYDVTNPSSSSYVNYINSRDFVDLDEDGIGSDDSPEGLKFVPAAQSPTKKPLLLAAFEVSGDVGVYGMPSSELVSEGLKLAVISDTHLYDAKALGSEGSAFEEYLAGDRKMLKESEPILDETINRILASDVQYVLVAGDLTKDGELVNHQLLAQKLKILEDSGKKVFVINGNHDLSNAHAVSFSGAETTPVDTINSSDFRSIYSDFGYEEAIAKDTASLSYTVNLGDAYRLIVVDSCIYNDDKGAGRSQETGGKINEATMNWVLDQAKDAVKAGRRPIGMMHHGLVSHTAVQPQFFTEYLVDDYQTVSQKFADAGIGMVFTGHFHSQDASVTETAAGKKLYDVETGSLLTYPTPIHFVTLNKNAVDYSSIHVDRVEGVSNFKSYAQNYLMEGLVGLVPGMLKAVSPGMTDAEAAAAANGVIPGAGMTVAQFMASCMKLHYVGDETPGQLGGVITALQNYNAGDAATNGLYQTLGNAAWALANDTTGDLTAPKLDTVSDNSGSFTLSDLPSYSGGGSKGGGGGAATPAEKETTTKKNEDGSTTTTVTDAATGRVTDTTVWADGSKLVVVKEKDGTITAESSAANGVKSVTVTTPDGNTTSKVTLPASGKRMLVRIPLSDADEGTVAILKKADGTEEILKMSVAQDDALLILLSDSAEIKIIQNEGEFSDTKRHWASDSVGFVTARGLFSGTSSGSFSPDAPMNRGMLVTVLHRLENTPQGAAPSFDDVTAGQYYTDAVGWAAQKGIITGMEGGFKPGSNISREQLATILYRYAAPGQTEGSLAGFADADSVSSWGREAMKWAAATGLFKGDQNGNLNPQGSATRAEVAAILERFVTSMVK